MAPHPSSDLLDEKRALRRSMAERRAAVPAVRRQACAEAVAARWLALPAVSHGLRAGAVVAGYVAMRGELDPAPALAAARAAGAVVALPRVGALAPRMRFHRLGEGDALVAGPWGLMEPDAAAVEISPAGIDVMIVPGLAFDGEGRRLGYGKGHYDEVAGPLRAAAEAGLGGRRGLLVGFAYDFQIVDRCPAGEGDVALDLVVTEARVLGAAAAAGGGAA